MLKQFHDASLLKVTLDWQNRTGEIHAQTANQVKVISFSNFELAHIPCKLPWGRSFSINSVSLESIPEGEKLRVEMQSGDVAEFVAKKFIFG